MVHDHSQRQTAPKGRPLDLHLFPDSGAGEGVSHEITTSWCIEELKWPINFVAPSDNSRYGFRIGQWCSKKGSGYQGDKRPRKISSGNQSGCP